MMRGVRIVWRLAPVLLCGMLVCVGGVARAANDDMTVPTDSTVSVHRMLGETTARAERRFYPGTFAMGVGCGMTLPFVSGYSASVLYHATDKSGIIGIGAGLTTAGLWAWGGHRLVSRRPVSVPERYRADLGARDREEFDAGYTAIAGDKRTAQYIFGSITGMLIPLGVLIYALSHMGPIGV